jgi:hypothetical protein
MKGSGLLLETSGPSEDWSEVWDDPWETVDLDLEEDFLAGSKAQAGAGSLPPAARQDQRLFQLIDRLEVKMEVGGCFFFFGNLYFYALKKLVSGQNRL